MRSIARQTLGWLGTRSVLIILSAATVLLFILGPFITDLGADDAGRCFAKQGTKPDPVWAYYDYPNDPPGNPAAGKPVQLSLVPDQSTTIHFGRSQAVRSSDIDYKLSLQGSAAEQQNGQEVQTLAQRLGDSNLQLDILQFQRSDGAALDTDLVKARARVVGDRVRVSVCIDRRNAHDLGDPGTYRGTVSIIDPRVARVDLPLDFDASDPDWARALSLVGLGLLAGSWVTWVVKEQKADSDRFHPSQWAEWSVTAIGLISAVAGAVAALAVYQASYLNNPIWGVSIGDTVALLTGSFVAFMGATTTLHVAGLADRFRGSPSDARGAVRGANDAGQGASTNGAGAGGASTGEHGELGTRPQG